MKGVDQSKEYDDRFDVAVRLVEHGIDLLACALEVEAPALHLPVEIGVALREAFLDALEVRLPSGPLEPILGARRWRGRA